MKSLYCFTVDELRSFVKDELRIDNWSILNTSAENRVKRVDYTNYYHTLQKRAKENGISANPTEIISWLDTLNLMYYITGHIAPEISKELAIIQEMQIPFTNKRADYVLIYRKSILIIEFSYDRFSEEYRFEKKLTQAVGYKELLSNIMPRHIDIGTYTFLIEPETDEQETRINKLNKYTGEEECPNNEKITELGGYINLFFQKDYEDAMYYLGKAAGYIEFMEDKNSGNGEGAQ